MLPGLGAYGDHSGAGLSKRKRSGPSVVAKVRRRPAPSPGALACSG
jgi:hypothetical protein